MNNIDLINFITYQPRSTNNIYTGGRLVGVQGRSDFKKNMIEIPDLVLNENEQQSDADMYDLVFENGKRVLVKRDTPIKHPKYLNDMIVQYLRYNNTDAQNTGLDKIYKNKNDTRDIIRNEGTKQIDAYNKETNNPLGSRFWSEFGSSFKDSLQNTLKTVGSVIGKIPGLASVGKTAETVGNVAEAIPTGNGKSKTNRKIRFKK